MGQIVNLDTSKKGHIEDLESLKSQLRPMLRTYLERMNIKFGQKSQFHCFNSSAHNHGDKDASASIYKNTAFKCFACGISGDIFKACNMIEGKAIEGKDFIDTVRYLCDLLGVSYREESFKAPPSEEKRAVKSLTAEYVYTDSNEEPKYKVQRFEWEDNGERKKEMLPMRLQGKKWIAGYKEVERFLYRLPEVKKAISEGQTVFFVEGEKCVEIVRNLGYIATTISGGSNAWVKPHTLNYIKELFGVNLVIMPDNDTAGKRFAELVASDLAPVAGTIKILELPGLPQKGDIEQWLQLGGTKEKLLELASATKEWSRENKVQQQQKSVYIHNNCYFKVCKDYDKKISNFIIEPIECIQSEGIQEYIALVKTDANIKFEVQFDLEAFINKGKFKTVFRHSSLSFTGNDDDLQDIKVIFGSQAHDIKQGVKCIGYQKDKAGNEIFVTDKKAIDKDGKEINNIVLMERYKQINTSILEVDPITQEELQIIAKPLLNFNTLDKTSTILGFCMGCFLKEKLWAKEIKYNHLLISGEAGSGKSQTVETVIMSIFSTENKSGAGTSTPFVTLKNSCSSNAIPYIIDEYKPYAIGKHRVLNISELLRHTYERTVGERGTQSQTINEYEALAPVILIGEEGIDEPANKERGLELLFSKKDIDNSIYKSSFLTLKNNKNLLRKLGRSMLATALKTDIKTVEHYHTYITEMVLDKISKVLPNTPDRIVGSIINCCMGIVVFNDLLCDLGMDIKAATGYHFEEMEDAIIRAVFENIMDGEGNTKSIVDQYIEVMDRMVGKGILRSGYSYQLIDGNEKLALDITSIYDDFTKYVSEYKIPIEMMGDRQFKKQLQKMSYFVSKDNAVWFSYNTLHGKEGKTKRPYVLSVRELSSKLDISNFLDNGK